MPPVADMPKVFRIDCTGLGGHDLRGDTPWHLCIRTDRHGQSVYGSSVAAIETTHTDRHHRHVYTVALTKAVNEFLVLYYFATDSASSWDAFLSDHLPDGTWPHADIRRHNALAMFAKCHVAPSYRRLPHGTLTDCVSLLVDLLLGTGKQRYLCTNPVPIRNREAFVRGFSAGSYGGLSLLHLLWKLPHVHAAGKLGGPKPTPVPLCS